MKVTIGIRALWRTEWEKDCLKWRGAVLTGVYAHWCGEWDGLPVDETSVEWPCGCYPWAKDTAAELRDEMDLG